MGERGIGRVPKTLAEYIPPTKEQMEQARKEGEKVLAERQAYLKGKLSRWDPQMLTTAITI